MEGEGKWPFFQSQSVKMQKISWANTNAKQIHVVDVEQKEMCPRELLLALVSLLDE